MPLADHTQTKTCSVCSCELPMSKFAAIRRKNRSKIYRSAACRECLRKRVNAQRAANPDAFRTSQKASREREACRLNRRKHKLKAFGVTVEQYNEMLDRQDGVCAICRGPETRTNKGVIRSLSVDHCHETGTVRGLLCASCNTLLGMAQDDEGRLRAAINYLAEARITEVIS